MAIERLNSAEFEAFWGHTFDDKCPARPYRGRSANDGRSARAARRDLLRGPQIESDLLAWEDRERARAVARLTEFLDSTEQGEPIDVFRKGQTFKLADWPKGTILRYKGDWAKRDSEGSEFRFAAIAQAKTNVGGLVDCLIVLLASEGELDISLNSLVRLDPANVYLQSVVLGEATHRRYISPGSQYDQLLRYNLIEVWQLGNGVREQVRVAGFKPKKAR